MDTRLTPAKNNCYAVHIGSPTHACMQCIRAPHMFVDLLVIVMWQAQNGDPIRAYRSSKTPDKYVFSVIHTARRYSSSWSRALTTAWSRAYCAITIMASNT